MAPRAPEAKTQTNRQKPKRKPQPKEEYARKNRNARLKKAYGISEQDYERMLEAQGGFCAICRCLDPLGRRLAVDHDHTNGRVRGLLCRSCNTALGKFSDSPLLLLSALAYVSKSKDLPNEIGDSLAQIHYLSRAVLDWMAQDADNLRQAEHQEERVLE